jgi:G2/mitotic-specific cyclin 3/4
MLNNGGLKAAAKRTAFGDVSNIAKNLSSARDDSALAGKSIDYVKPLNIISDKSATFLRPAQRPLNVTTVKPIQIHNQTNIIEPTSTKLSMGQEQSVLPATKRIVSKKSTTVYKDNDENEAPEAAPIAPVHQTLAPRHYKSQPQLKQDQIVIRQTQSKPAAGDSSKNVAVDNSYPVHERLEDDGLIDGTEEEYVQLHAIDHRQGIPSQATQEAVIRLHRQLQQQPPLVSEPEEYWEEEDEEEMYDEAGYTTGGATTGGATTIFFPKETKKSRKELAEAKAIVESMRTPEEIEDDLWDTSMVAEYSEEIFEYMKELEVRVPSPMNHIRYHCFDILTYLTPYGNCC